MALETELEMKKPSKSLRLQESVYLYLIIQGPLASVEGLTSHFAPVIKRIAPGLLIKKCVLKS